MVPLKQKVMRTMESIPQVIKDQDDFDNLIQTHGAEEAIPTLAKIYWDKPSDLVNIVRGSQSLRITKSSISTVAIFFHALSIGGGERVTRDLAASWLRMGFNVVVMTNTDPTEDDYTLPKEIKRVTIPTYIGDLRENYAERCRGLRKALLDSDVDLVVFSQWFSDVLAFDILSAKTLGIPFIFFIQTSFTQFFLDADLPSRFVDIPMQYSLADGIVCLSEMDQHFWKKFHSNTRCTNNPVTQTPPASPAPLLGHTVIWPARLHVDKYPLRVIPIMKALVEKVPDAVIWMIGPTDPALENELMSQAAACGIKRNVVICGPQSEEQMTSWYEKADVFLLTSRREGWSLALGEALEAGLPCVMYSLPYLTLTHNNPAIMEITQNDAEGAANALASILLDKQRARCMGEKGRAFMNRISKYDYEAFWRSCFNSVLIPEYDQDHSTAEQQQKAESESSSLEKIMWQELLEAYRSHLATIELERGQHELCRDQLKINRETIARLETTLQETQAELNHILASKSFKIGIALTQFPRTILSFFRGRKRSKASDRIQ